MKKKFIFILLIFFFHNSIAIDSSKKNIEKKFKTDLSKFNIDLNQILDGGPRKDEIPAINQPKFIKVNQSDLKDGALGVLIKLNNEIRFYPYNILVWHEIVNDNIGNNYFSITFCPLCGSAIAFNRKFNGKVHLFGVSGKLYESNLLMYDNITESFWSQSQGKAVVGKYTGKKLKLFDISVIEFNKVREKYTKAKILSKDTGYKKNYNFYPYGNYEENSLLYFPTSKFNNKYHSKEIMYVFRFDNTSFTFPVKNFKSNKYIYNHKKKSIIINNDEGEINIFANGKLIPGYYEMWFSWAIHNQEGIIIDKIK